MRRTAVLAVSFLLAAPTASAQIAPIGVLSGGDLASARINAAYMPVAVSGGITIDFHGDRASGCASAGLCDYSGTISWDPGRTAVLEVFAARSRQRRQADWLLDFGDPYGRQTATRAEVERALPGGGGSACGDVNAPEESGFYASSRNGAIDFGPGRGDLDIVGTRCAGPLASDVAAAMPSVRIAAARAMRGNQSINLSGTHGFVSHGFAGTVTSTLRLRTGRPVRTHYGSSRGGASDLLPFRAAELSYRVVSVTGDVRASFSGLTDPDLCGPLDACGLLGTMTVNAPASSGDAAIVAIGPRRVSRHDLLVALGLAKGRRRSGIEVSGTVDWKPPAGSMSFSSSRSDGSAACNDAVPLRASDAVLKVSGTRLTASYLAGAEYGNATRTRCPGPELEDVSGAGLAGGSVPVSALRGRELTLRLTRGFSATEQGYQARTSPDMTIVLRRSRHARGSLISVIARSGGFSVR